ncbi:la-related protein 7-like isoform X2 [Oscarella lobularis]|uniref:la-related protein 7-like isoform X2 n=1 Tax=Oscarella lobularis TaxID=121494 RepID=UPI00331320DA
MGDEKKSDDEKLDAIRQQMEFYLGDPNLRHDRFTRSEIEKSEHGYVPLWLFLKFNKLRQLTNDVETICKGIRKSDHLELSECGKKVRRKRPLEPIKDTDPQTIYVDRLPVNATHDRLRNIFSRYGVVDYISLPCHTSGRPKGFAFVEFETAEAATRALKEFGNMKDDDAAAGSDVGAVDMKKRKRKRERETEKDKESSTAKRSKLDGDASAATDNDPDPMAKSLKIMSKQQWAHFKSMYKSMQRDKIKKLKAAVREQRKNEEGDVAAAAAAEKSSLALVPGSIIRFEGNLDGVTFSSLKAQFSSFTRVSYLDYEEGNSVGHVRFPDAVAAASLLNSLLEGKFPAADGIIKKLSLRVLRGDEEASYVERVKEGKKARRSRPRSKRRGYEKWIAKADAVAEKKSADVPSTIHIVFSDSEGEEEKKAGRDASQQPAVDETVREKDKKKKKKKKKKKRAAIET